jgi:hypothetical protein
MTTHNNTNTTSDREGVQSTGPAPTEYLNRVATTLRNPPDSPISTVKDFTKSLGVKLIRRNRHALIEVTSWLEKNLGQGKVDHYMPMTLETEDILILIQPYDHPDLTELERIERLGGYIVQPDPQWGFFTPFASQTFTSFQQPPRQSSKHIKQTTTLR